MAMAVHGVVRATRDMDFFVRPERENIERLKEALRAAFSSDPCIDDISADDLLGDYPAVQYVPPAGVVSMDILTRLGEAFSYDDIEGEVRDIDGIDVTVATPTMLIEMKKDTVRPQDKADVAAMRKLLGIVEEQ